MRTSRLTQSQTKWSTCSRPSSTGMREPLKMIERYIILSPYQLLSLIVFGIHDCSQPHYWHGIHPFPICNHWFMLVLDSILSLHVSADEMDLTTSLVSNISNGWSFRVMEGREFGKIRKMLRDRRFELMGSWICVDIHLYYTYMYIY